MGASFHSLSSPSFICFGTEGFYVPDPCQLTFANTLLLSNAAVSLGGAFVSLEISLSSLIFFSLFSFILAWTFISLQIKEFWIMGLSINDSVFGGVFFFLIIAARACSRVSSDFQNIFLHVAGKCVGSFIFFSFPQLLAD